MIYETAQGKTTTSRCLPIDEKYRRTPFKQQLLENTDQVEILQIASVALVILDIFINIYKLWAARLQTIQIIAAQAAAQTNTPIAQRRNSQYSIAMS